MAFNDLSTERFRQRMRPYAVDIYKGLFPGCTVSDLRADGVKVHILDQEFGIDTLAVCESGQWFSIQEKYRDNEFLVNRRFRVDKEWPDFTQEHMNAAGTEYETNGEWFHLGAQLYFYGWANASKTGFEKWVLLDIAKYKMIVENAGGLSSIGRLYKNGKHGSASFYCIPVNRLRGAWLATSATQGLVTP